MSDIQQLNNFMRKHAEDDTKNFGDLASALDRIDKNLVRIEAVFSTKFKNFDTRFDRLEGKLDPIFEAYDGILFGRKVFVGVASFVAALASLGGAIYWVLEHIAIKK